MAPNPDQREIAQLEMLAREWFGELSAAETRILRAASSGQIAVCGPNQDDNDPANDASRGDKWGEARQVRAGLIRRLFVDRRCRDLVDPQGIWIYGALITDSLDLSKITSSFGLTLWHCRLVADANLRDITVPHLDLQDSWIPSTGADRCRVAGYLLLRNTTVARGSVRLLNCRIAGNLECDGAKLTGGNGPALSADGATVAGAVFLRNQFEADGDVRLVGTRIGGNLDCNGAKFVGTLNVRGSVVMGELLLAKLINPGASTIILTNTSVQALRDDGQWPNKLDLDGFVYQRISEGPADATSRLVWLARQDHFTPQPYRQLAKVLSDEGKEGESQEVMIELERRERATDWERRPASLLLRVTTGYGYRPLRAIWGLAGFSLLGWIVFRRAHLAGAMAPTDKDAYDYYKRNGAPPPYYERLSPFMYSLENSLPLVKLGQADHWQPDPCPQTAIPTSGSWRDRWTRLILSPKFLRGFLWSLILMGWVFATLFAAGVAGLVHSR